MSDLTHPTSDETFMARLWRRLRGTQEPNLRESIEDALDETEREGTEFSLEERHMLRNLLGFRDVRVDDVMVPRADISAIDLSTVGEDVLAVFVGSGHSRMPVYRDTLDSPVGMLHLKDVIAARKELAKPTDTPFNIQTIMREVLFVPPSMPALDLLLKMQATRTHLALVIDEYGGTDGLVTIEDLIEEIVGDIEDEHDDVGAAPLRQTSPDSWRASARVALETLEEVLGSAVFDETVFEDIDTLGGLVFAIAGRVPQRGEIISHRMPDGPPVEFVIRDADPRRIKSLDVKLVTPPPA